MGKLSAGLIVVAAFGYAVWLVWRRKMPSGWNGRRSRGAFLLLTLFFMGWLGVPLSGAEDGGGSVPAAAAGEAGAGGISEAMVAAWRILGMMQERNLLGALGTNEDRATKARLEKEFKELEAQLEQCSEELGKVKRRPWNIRRRRELDARETSLSKEYFDFNDRFGREVEGAIMLRNQRLFADAVEEEAAAGRLRRETASLLLFAYNSVNMHFDRNNATCYMGVSTEEGPRTAIVSEMEELASRSAAGTADAGAMRQAEERIAGSLAGLYRLHSQNEFADYSVITRERVVLGEELFDAETPDEARAAMLEVYCRDAADVLVKIALLLPADWTSRQ